MTSQPKFHWQFKEREGATVVDSVNNSVGKGRLIQLDGGIGRIGNAIHLTSQESHINLGKAAGQLGTSDFTMAFGTTLPSCAKAVPCVCTSMARSSRTVQPRGYSQERRCCNPDQRPQSSTHEA